MTHVTCRLTAKNRDQLRNPTLGNRVWATFFIVIMLRLMRRVSVIRICPAFAIYLFLICFFILFLTIPVGPIISISPVFAKFAGLIELRL